MASYKLIAPANGFRAWKARIAAAYNDVNLEVPEFKFGRDNLTEEFKAKSLTGKVPVLETPKGCLLESNAIARYLARMRPDTGLYGRTTYESGLVDQWMDFCSLEVEAPRGVWLYPLYGYTTFDADTYATAKADMTKALNALNAHLASRTYMVGNHITLADIVLVTALVDLYARVFSPEFRAPFVHVNRWFNTIVNQPKVAGIVGKVTLATSEQKATSA